MNMTVSVGDPHKHGCRALVLGCFENVQDEPLFGALDAALGGALRAMVDQGEFPAKLNSSRLLHTFGRLPAERVLLVGLGRKEQLTPDSLRQAAGTAVQALRPLGIKTYSTTLHQTCGNVSRPVEAVVEGTLLGGYSFSQYKTDTGEGRDIAEVTLLFSEAPAARRAENVVAETQVVCTQVLAVRDLVSQPGNVATPAYLAEQAREMSVRYGVLCRVLEREELERLGMNALLAVGKGSHQSPRFIILEYQGGSDGRNPVVLVGKGVTFDSGGISLKPREGMEKMKDDMAGGAAVLGTVMAVAALKLPVNLVGLIPAAENLPGGGAYKPGDIVTAMSGKTIEIVNTDAEGRLLLCDALYYAQRYKPATLIDLATLTGACTVALGTFATGLMGNSAQVKRALQTAGETTGERVWELPLWEEYGELMKSDIADLKNAGGAMAGTITAGWFLQQFVGKAKWAHLDMAGTAWEEKGRPYLPKGATGAGVRLLVEYLRGVK